MAADKPTRRKLLIAAGVLGAGAAGAAAWKLKGEPPERAEDLDPELVPPTAPSAEPATHARSGFYRKLGRTGLQVSTVSMGAGSIDDPKVLIRAIEKGINYIDTAICYGDSELVIRDALKKRPDLRKKLIIATKWDVDHDWSKQRILGSLDRSLRRLGVPKVEIMQIHWLGGGHMRGDTGFNRLNNPALYEAMDEARRSGKVRYFGATSHDANRSAILLHAIKTGKFDMLLVKMNVLDFEKADMPALLAAARKADVGIVAMKTQPSNGKMPPGFEKSKWSVYQANLRWALSKGITSVSHSGIGDDPDTQDAAIEAARGKLSRTDKSLLEHYASAMSPQYCRGCDDLCGPACPADIAIAPVLQFNMYDRDYDRHERGRRHYLNLPAARRWSSLCESCRACTDACPYGVDAASRVRDAKRRFDGDGSVS